MTSGIGQTSGTHIPKFSLTIHLVSGGRMTISDYIATALTVALICLILYVVFYVL